MNQLNSKDFSNKTRWLFKLTRGSFWRIDQIGALVGLLLLLTAFSILSPNFRQPGNFMLIATMASTIGIIAVGQTLVLITGGIDLSVSSVAALSGLIAASFMSNGFGIIPHLPALIHISQFLSALFAERSWALFRAG